LFSRGTFGELTYHNIGAGLIEAVASKHADVAIFAGARNPSKADTLIALQKKYPGKIFPITHDVGDEASNQAAAKLVQEKFGYVDIVIGNAGTLAINLALKTLLTNGLLSHRRQSQTT
jgi:NAD(P)-dependent dehydrogenase (short-subunit alcohol dehydrogenase family)